MLGGLALRTRGVSVQQMPCRCPFSQHSACLPTEPGVLQVGSLGAEAGGQSLSQSPYLLGSQVHPLWDRTPTPGLGVSGGPYKGPVVQTQSSVPPACPALSAPHPRGLQVRTVLSAPTSPRPGSHACTAWPRAAGTGRWGKSRV